MTSIQLGRIIFLNQFKKFIIKVFYKLSDNKTELVYGESELMNAIVG